MNVTRLPALACLVGALIAGTAAVTPSAAVAAAPAKSAVAWQFVSSDAEVDRVFALARSQGKPVFLYWGAVWCPPCNQVKATLFNRAEFIERSKAFVPVYVDGDKPGAQKVASRFKVSGYPTMILFKPDGTEVTRLPGEVDPERYLLTLTAGLDAQVPVRELLQRAASGQPLAAEHWRVLAYYAWDTDQQQVLPTAELPSRLSKLATGVPADLAPLRDRIAFKALAAAARAKTPADPALLESGRALVDRMLADTQGLRGQSDLLLGQAEPVAKMLAQGDARRQLATRWDAAIARLLEDPGLSRPERVDAWDTRVSLWKLASDPQPLAAARQDQVRQEVARIVAATTDRYERQAVVPNAAYVLAQAGLLDDSDALLKAELPRAVAPYYHMLGLSSNAKRRQNHQAALDWSEQAWRKSEGPATRIQWGSSHLRNLLDLSPDDVKRVQAAGSTLISQIEPRAESFYERNQRSLQRLAKRLAEWQADDPARAKVVTQLKAQLDKTCRKLPAKDVGRTHCEQVFQPPSV